MLSSPNNEPPKLRRTPPPNYQQRATKLKVFAAVAVVILLMAIAERTRHPEVWNWFPKTSEHPKNVDTRVIPPPSRMEFDPPGTILQSRQIAEAFKPALALTEAAPAEMAWRQGWQEIYTRLDPAERTLLLEILSQGRGTHTLDAAASSRAEKLLGKLNDLWKTYREYALQSLTELSADEQALWQAILRTADELWSQETRPALEIASHSSVVKGEPLASLNRFQQTLDEILLNLVQDDTPLRPDENQLWFRLMNQAHETPPAELNRRAISGVTYLQMFEQSSHYRGKVVSIRGAVRWAWKNQAVENPWGLQEYYVLWIQSQDSPNRPIMIHARTLPQGFPAIAARTADGSFTRLNEEVQLQGFFFKRQVYLTADGTHRVPLLLADSFAWKPGTAVASSGSPFEMSWPIFLSIVAGALASSLAAGGLIYWRLRQQTRGRVHEESIAQADLSALQNVELTPSVAEGLQQLERD